MMDPAAKDLLRRARDSLDDARLLAERRRRNEIVLTRLALHQALQVISIEEGLDGSDTLQMETLLRRVPADHRCAALVGRLRSDEAQTIAAVAELVEALEQFAPEPAARSRPAAAHPDGEPPPEGTGRLPVSGSSGVTALGSSPQGRGRADPASSFPSTVFWALMDRWQIGDENALALIGHAGGLTRKGTRPRFRLQDEEAARYASLRTLDTALATLGSNPADWLAAARTEAPFKGNTPLVLLTEGGREAAQQLIHMLNRQGLKAALGG